jgi:hypothetical protein
MLPKHVRALFPKIRTLKGTYTKQTVSTFLIRSASELDDLRVAADPLTLAKPGSGISRKWAGRVTRQMARLDVIGSFVVAAGVDVFFSLYHDMQMRDVYGLTDEQIVRRTVLAGAGGFLAATAVVAVGYLAFAGSLPPVGVGILVAVGVELAWEGWVEPFVFRKRNLYGPYEPRPAVMTSANRLHPSGPWP